MTVQSDEHVARIGLLWRGNRGQAVMAAKAEATLGPLISVAILAVLRVADIEVFRRLMNGVEPNIVGRIQHAPGLVAVRDVRARWEGYRHSKQTSPSKSRPPSASPKHTLLRTSNTSSSTPSRTSTRQQSTSSPSAPNTSRATPTATRTTNRRCRKPA